MDQSLLQHPAPADQLNPAQILCLKPHNIESVQTGARLAVVAEQPVEVGQALKAVRHGFAVDHDPRAYRLRARSSKLMVGAYGRRMRLAVALSFEFGFQSLNGALELPRSGLLP